MLAGGEFSVLEYPSFGMLLSNTTLPYGNSCWMGQTV